MFSLSNTPSKIKD